MELNWANMQSCWAAPRMIRAVLFHTNEKYMRSGTVKFYVDDVECPDTGNVGIDAKGGVFNCNL